PSWAICRYLRGRSADVPAGLVGPISPAQQCGEAGARGLALAHRRAGGPGSAPSLRVREAPVWASPLRGALCLRGAPEVAKRWRRLPPTAGAVSERWKWRSAVSEGASAVPVGRGFSGGYLAEDDGGGEVADVVR